MCKYSKETIRNPKAYAKAERKKQKKLDRDVMAAKGNIVAIIRDKFNGELLAYSKEGVYSLLLEWGACDGRRDKGVTRIISAALEQLRDEGRCWSERGAAGEVVFYTHRTIVEISQEDMRERLVEKYEKLAAHRSRFHPLLRKSGEIAA